MKKKQTEVSYFAAANTANGFYSCFPALFDPKSGEWNHIYIVKGGPGTGKSGFMKRAAEAAEKRGCNVERFYCSSDTNSLDGVRIPSRGIAFLDGTAPHAVDPVYPGALEEILNMGMFFDIEHLRGAKEEIQRLHAENAACHARASRYLRAAGEIHAAFQTLVRDAFLSEKADAAAARMLHGTPVEKEENIHICTRFVTANSVQGMVHLPTAETHAARCVMVDDKKHLAAFVLSSLVRAAEKRGVSYTRFASPLQPEETEGLYFPGMDTLYMTDRYGVVRDDAEKLNTARFFDAKKLSSVRESAQFASKCETALTEGALEALAEAGRIHDELESHYVSAMDFTALNAYTDRFLKAFLA
ncbi:MAG: hypothetical protein J6I50_07585 [Clostridia bacterium]|nr:hypothetical protein [Clostridia bacterium]